MNNQYFKDNCLKSIKNKSLLAEGNINQELFFNIEPGIHSWLAALDCDNTLTLEFDEKTNNFRVELQAPTGTTESILSVYKVMSKQFSLEKFIEGLFDIIEETNDLHTNSIYQHN